MTTETPPTTSKKFDLLEEPWVTCLMIDGQEELLSLRGVLDCCDDISRISGDSPHQATAMLRLLLSIFWRAHLTAGELGRRRTDAEQWWTDLFLDGDRHQVIGPLHAYLQSHSDRFSLFHPTAPFFQVADLQKADESYSPISRLIPEAENDYFALRADEGRAALDYAEAARWLVCIQAYDYSGIKPGAVGDPRVKGGKGYPIGPGWSGQVGAVVLHGRTLRETLLLNTPASLIQSLYMENKQDAPPWERDPDGPAPRAADAVSPEGPCDTLTWQSRRVRLHRDEDLVVGVLVSNGDKIQNKNQFLDPMTAYRYSRNQSTKVHTVHMPQEHDPDLTIWRGLAPILARTPQSEAEGSAPTGRIPSTVDALQGLALTKLPEDFTVVTELIGARYGAQQSSHADTIHTVLPLRMSFLLSREDRLAQAVVNAGRVALDATVALGQFAGTLLQAAGGDYEFQSAPRAAVLHGLQSHFAQWVVGIVPDADMHDAAQKWEDLVRRAVIDEARTLLRSASPKAMIGTYVGAESPRLVSGAAAWGRFQRRLDELLPTTDLDRKHPETAQAEGE
ncbi:type I-E CRISPR-associated protein Cse1/CasA [Nesterenkonia marinintestina]|uniref:type I-E CRISPR-associated protein Cse1/CasA n=1 Tax=Nesterenkonia marinintestina TaxID=2979865 RepID=UPI0021BFF58E|nr:type I-E CRISPR-associated protein Cse1/CasA [Nesterenkonia sp. GX14115]